MENSSKQQQLLDLFNKVEQIGVNYLQVEDEFLDSEFITVNGLKLYNFGNCGYLALEQDIRIKQKSIEYINRYGSMYATSRSFASLKILGDTEQLMAEIFERPVLIGNTTGLIHIAAIPILAEKKDAILADKQVHRTVSNAILMAKAQGTTTETIPHNNIDILEKRIIELSKTHNRIWYMADSIYSMFGDAAPLIKLRELLDKFDQFYLYIDDAHGMSWAGKNGAGFLRSQINWHPKLIMATSFQKGFGAFGAGLVMPDEAMKKKIQYLGSIFIFSGPPTPATLGGINASAAIHLSDEIYTLQARLQSLVAHFSHMCHLFNLPLVSKTNSPVLFIGIGEVDTTISIAKSLIDKGFFTNTCAYPAVPIGNAGLRITLSLHHNNDGISKLLKCIKEELLFHDLNTEEILLKYRRINQFEEINQ
jgi:7-keto-8-aminopelargonate synthetase-like enzyme